jgi:FHA domain
MTAVILLILRLGMAFALYVFLGWGFLVLWRDLKRHSDLLASRQVPQITLAAQMVEGDMVEYQFKGQEVLIGREQSCDVPLEDLTVSGQHARLVYHHGQWWIVDLNSRNGTYLNKEPVISQVVLATGDELKFGGVVVQIAIGDR